MSNTVVERYADNGEFSHYDLVNNKTGETISELIVIAKPFYKAKDGSIVNGIKIGNTYYAPKDEVNS